RGGLPRLSGLPVAVPEDERKFPGVYRDLIEDVSVVAVQRLSRRIGAGGVVRALLDGVESAGGGDDRSAHRETALLPDHQRLGLSSRILRTRRSDDRDHQQDESTDHNPPHHAWIFFHTSSLFIFP